MNKNKKKVKRAVSRRFKVTKTGKVLHARQNAGHRKSHKSKGQIRRSRAQGELTGVFAKKIKRMLNVA